MKLKQIYRLMSATLIITGFVVFSVAFPVGCRITEDGIEIISCEAAVPKILAFNVEDNQTLSLVCSESVSVKNVLIKSAEGDWTREADRVEYDENGSTVTIGINESTEVGKSYVLTGAVKDGRGNSLTFSLPFTGFNKNPARLLLSEIRTKHSSSGGIIKKCEYVEFVVIKGGCTAGLELVSGSDGESKKYSFPMMEVKRGEYITVHMRTLSEGDCIDELEENICLSTAQDSSDESRDLWEDNVESRISENDIIVLRDNCRDTVMDCVLFSGSDKTSWYYSGQKALSSEVFESGVWQGETNPQNSVCSDYISLTRTLSRFNLSELFEKYSEKDLTDETIITAGKEDWAVVTSATPGKENCLIKFEK